MLYNETKTPRTGSGYKNETIENLVAVLPGEMDSWQQQNWWDDRIYTRFYCQ